MEKNLNKLVWAIISEIIDSNKNNYPFLEKHIPYVSIKSYEVTGVGIYVYFTYSKENLNFDANYLDNICLSSDKMLDLDALEHGLNFELNITNGKISLLEIVTNGEDWNGYYKTFSFSTF